MTLEEKNIIYNGLKMIRNECLNHGSCDKDCPLFNIEDDECLFYCSSIFPYDLSKVFKKNNKEIC